MAWAIGAGMRDMGQIKGTFGTHPDTGPERHTIMLAFYLGAIIVNQAGRRFIDESVSYKLLGDACLQQPGHLAFQVLDQTVMDATTPGVPLFDFAPAVAAGTLLQADSLAGLAAACGIDAAALEDTVARYNAGIAAGREPEFGRDGLCNHTGAMIPIAKPPFYAYPSTSTVLATYCGLATTPRAEVLDVFGAPIPGLFAAGEVVGGFHGAAYMTGSSLGKAAFFGGVAGRMAASS
jgi:fumarate reductase flavoprotein subunit